MKLSRALPNQTEQGAWYSQPCSNPESNVIMQNPRKPLTGCLSFPLHSEPESRDRGSQYPQHPAHDLEHTGKRACLGQLTSRFSLEHSPSSSPLPALILLILQDSAKLHLLQEVTAGNAGLVRLLSPHGPVDHIRPSHSTYHTSLLWLVCQANLILHFHELLD